MRDIIGIKLISVIVHIFSPRVDEKEKRASGWIMSDEPMDLAQNQPAHDFVTIHIRNVLADQNLRAAKFTDLAPDRPGVMTDQLIKKPDQLIPLSQNLAKTLFEIMERDRRTSVCDLAVCLFTAENYPEQRFVALLKLDPSTVFHNQVNIVNGKQVVNLVIQNLAFTTERLQKAALIQAYDNKKPYDLLLLDTQVSADRGPGVAIYFRKTFLGCELVYDSTQLTGNLYTAFLYVVNQLINSGFADSAIDFSTLARNVFKLDEFHLEPWLESLPYSQAEKAIIEGVLREKLPEINFEIDLNRVISFPAKVRYQGSHGLIVEIDEKYEAEIEVTQIPATPIKPAHWRICTETLTWKKVK